jgi:Fibronectin type III domain
MTRVRAVAAGTVSLLAVAAVATALWSSGAASAVGSPPPWVPGGVSEDQNAIGGLEFFDASGAQVTSGPIGVAPFAAYAVGLSQTEPPIVDTKATLFAYVPQVGQTPDVWSTDEAIGLSTAFPVASAPAPIAGSALPVNTGNASDKSLAAVAGQLPNASTAAGYQDVYEIRLYPSSPGNGLSLGYDYADVTINTTTNTWTLIYTPTAAVPAAPTAVTAVAGDAAATVSWLAPGDNGGSAVTGYDVQYSANSGSTWTSASSAFHTRTALSAVVTGLSNAGSYEFRVAAINANGTGAYSDASTAVHPVIDASQLSNGRSALIKYGSAIVVSTRLTDARTHAAIGATHVTLYSRAGTTGAYTAVKTLTTSATGAASLRVQPTTKHQYEWRFAGTTTHKAITSSVQTVSVTQAVSIAARPTKTVHTKSIKLYGTVRPAATGQRVYLQHLVGGTWKTVAGSAKLVRQKLPNGKTAVGYVFTIHEKAKGHYTFRVIRKATTHNAAGASAALKLTFT